MGLLSHSVSAAWRLCERFSLNRYGSGVVAGVAGRLATVLCWVMVVLSLGMGSLRLGAAPEPELPRPKSAADIKALYVYNFVKYTTCTNWLSDSSDPFVVGVAGQDEVMFRSLKQMLGQLKIKGRPIEVEPYDPDKQPRYQVLFFAKEKPWQEFLAKKLKSEGVLTVGEIDGLSERGMIELVSDQRKGKIEFRINVDAGQAAGLTFDTRLLRMASKVVRAPQTSVNADVAHGDGG